MTGNPSEAGVQPRWRRAVKAVEPIGRNLGRPSQQARKTDDLDLLIGRRLRERRILLAISQEELARRIGLSFQQLQKYEVGENRISAARLFKLSEILAVPISWFFRPATESRRTACDTSASGESRLSADDGREISAAQQLKLAQVVPRAEGGENQLGQSSGAHKCE